MTYSETEQVSREYYNSSDADRFYAVIWGGEDIHIGIYESVAASIFDASRRTVEAMAARLASWNASLRVLDIGSGYGGSARFLAHRFGCHVTCLNLSEVQNERNRALNRQQNLDNLIDVVDGSFEQLPFDAARFDVVWSQDALLHSGEKPTVFAGVHRVLKPGGTFLFTDPMQSDDCPASALQPVLERIHLPSMGSPGFYRGTAAELGWSESSWTDLSAQLPIHYGRVLDEVNRRESEISECCSRDYIERMKKGLKHWIDAGRRGHLRWGIFRFERP